MRLPLLAGLCMAVAVTAQNTFEINLPVPGLTNVAGGHQLPDGGFVFGGELNDGVVLIRTDSTGGVLWTRTLAEASNDEGIYDRSIAVSGDRIFMGGYAMGPGTFTRDGILHVLDLNGNVINQHLIDVGGGSNAIHGMTGIPGGVLIAGRAPGAGSYDMLLQRTDMNGSVTGSWSYGSADWDWAYEAVRLSNGDMALVGYGDAVGGPAPSAYVVRTDSLGQELWALGIDGASADEGYTLMEDPSNGDLYIGGRTLGMGPPNVRGFITKLTATGVHQWTRVIDNAFDVIGITTIVPGRYAALLRAQNITGGYGNYDVLVLQFNASGDLLSNQLFGSTASEYPVSLSRTSSGGLLLTSLKTVGGINSFHVVLTDDMGNGGCTGISVLPQWFAHTPTLFPHSSTLQSGQNLSSWITPASQPAVARQFVCCTYPVVASFTTQAGDALGYTFYNTSTGGGTAIWSVEGAALTGDTLFYSFPGPGTYNVCLSVASVCDSDSTCTDLAVATIGITGLNAGALFSASPNPATDQLHIRSSAEFTHIELLDAQGRRLRSLSLNGASTFHVSLEDIPQGVLFLRATGPVGVHTQRVVRQ
ncbi:MAG: T9SS type A sorting domain-containing protein [Flavobacteriales bacterium]|nr:T9SS type A sorting domain-containing protein [Flavobacteriales bacterium]